MSLLPLFQWFNNTALSLAMKQSTWAFAVTEMAHLIGLTLLGGAVLIIDLRLLGIILKDRPAHRIARDLAPILLIGLALLGASGVFLLAGEVMKCYYNGAFRLKILLLFLAALFYFSVHRRLSATEGFEARPASKLLASLSLTLWLGVAIAGRAVGFL